MRTDKYNKRFSIFSKGYRNKQGTAVMSTNPQQEQTVSWVYEYIISERARWATVEFRKIAPKATREEKQAFKALNFEYATFSGIFSYRNARSLVVRSPYLTIDIDHLKTYEETQKLKWQLINDKRIETALCFVSPSGLGLKWIISLPECSLNLPFKEQFEQMRRYVGFTYGIDPDNSGSDVCRACFLPYDLNCYVNSKYII